MNINKHDPETDMEMNMTPMIDVVFLLIIFFMIITDMSQADLEDLQLPVAQEADPDKPEQGVVRPVLNIRHTGEMLAKRELLFNPEESDEFKKINTYLFERAAVMNKAPLEESKPNGKQVPDDPLLIRADRVTPFKYIQKVMEVCGNEQISIWKLQLAAGEPEADDKNGQE